MRITRRKIEQAIADRFGLDVVLTKATGYWYFAADDDDSAAVIYRLPSTCIYMSTLAGCTGKVTIDWWLEMFENLLADGGYIDARYRYTKRMENK